MRRRGQTDNRGMSLVELIIVIAIMAIVGGILTLGIGMVSGKPAEQCARQIKAVMEQCRTTTMGKPVGDVSLKFEQDSDGVWVTFYQGGSSDRRMVGQGDVIVKYIVGGTEYDLRSQPLRIEFDRSTGGLRPSSEPGDGTTEYCSEFNISRAATVRNLTIERLTGKIQIK